MSSFYSGLCEFESSKVSHAVLRFARVYNLRLTGPEIRAFRAFGLGLQARAFPTPGAKWPKVTGPFPKNSRFAETIGGDGFDHDCRPREAVEFSELKRKIVNQSAAAFGDCRFRLLQDRDVRRASRASRACSSHRNQATLQNSRATWPSTARTSCRSARGLPIHRSRQIEAETKRVVVDVRQFAAAGEFGKAWRGHEHPPRIAGAESNANFIFAADQGRTLAICPRQPCCVERTMADTNRIMAQGQLVLRWSQRSAFIAAHRRNGCCSVLPLRRRCWTATGQPSAR